MALPKIKIPKMDIKKYLIGLGFSSAVILSATQLTAPSEGFVDTPYFDPVNIKTVCFGQTENSYLKTKIENKQYSEEECVLMLAQELTEVEEQITPLIKVPINDYQKAAFIDFSFNTGVPAFKNSTMLGLLNAGNTRASCEQLMKWVFAGSCKQGTKDCVQTSSGGWKLKLNGLVERRDLEMKYCIGEIKSQDDRR